MYQNIIYNSNGSCSRNSTTRLPNTSSDICIYEIPFFQMSGASKIDCPEVTCDLSGVSYNNILTATTQCFLENELYGTCFNNIKWNTQVYEDNVLSYSATFYTSSNVNDVATEASFTGSVVTAFNTLGYDYSFSGTQYTVSPNGFNSLKLSINAKLDYDDNCLVSGNTTGSTSCSCPSGYTLTPFRDACSISATTAATFNGSGTTIVAGSTNGVYGDNGTYFYENITNIIDLPITRTAAFNTIDLRTQSGGTITYTNVSDPGNTFWDSNGSAANGRLNNTSLSATTGEWVGFSECIDIPVDKTYYIGLAADNYARFKVDGELLVVLTGTSLTSLNFRIWHVFPYHLSSGKHIIEMEGQNAGSDSAFGAEIYDPVDFATLTGATTTGDTGLFFSTSSKVGDYYDLGTSVGYSCPSGYALDLCSGSATCISLIYTSSTCTFTGTCSGSTTEVICDLDFSGLTSGSTNVYPLTGETEIDLDFTFTANTKSLTGDTEFSFEIYKYNKDIGVFTQPSIYQSRAFTWSEFSGTSAFTTSVPVSNLNIDGDYLVKGYYNYNVCTEIASLLGDKRSTSQYKYGDKYSLYKKDRDFHFVAFKAAEVPFLNPVRPIAPVLNAFTVSSFITNLEQTDYNIQPAESEYLVSLNGLTLSRNLDYSISSNTLTTILKLSATTVPGDIITYAFLNSSTDNSTIRLDVFDISTSIVSGTTNNQGSNDVYYNTTTGKYEIYTSVTPSNGNDIVLNLNGVTLANNIDYYISTSNPKRIILEGNLAVGDIINLYYISNTDAQGNIDTTSISVGWSIETAPQLVNGEFIVEIADDEDFTNIIVTGQTDYVVGSTNYLKTLNLIGSAGDVQYYRVKNIKKYEDICGNLIETTAYSEIINITIQTNAINSY